MTAIGHGVVIFQMPRSLVTVKECLTIGNHSLIGMGAIVLQNVPEKSAMVGNPARFLRPTY
jgi:acetyltransferase-like isoleucine patch superfamily enzyme